MNCKIISALLVAALSFACLSAGAAIDLTDKVDLRFAEEYAFSTNRARLVSTLPPGSPSWYTYSILLAQTEGRLNEAGKLIDRWRDSESRDNKSLSSFEGRQTFLCWKGSASDIVRLRTALSNCGIKVQEHPRKTALAPNTYPSSLDQSHIAFESFLKRYSLSKDFSFLLVAREGLFGDKGRDKWLFNPQQQNLLPDTPNLYEQALAWLRSSEQSQVFKDAPVFRSFTLDQLRALADALKDTTKDLRSNGDYAKIVLAKMSRGADDDPNDVASAIALARKRVEFVDTLLPSLNQVKIEEYRAYLDLMRSCGKYAEARKAFTKYVGLLSWSRDRVASPVLPDDLVVDYLSAYRRTGDKLSDFAVKVEQGAFAKICAEADLLAGRDPSKVNTGCLSPELFKEIQERVELNWSKSNPKMFASDEDVSLSIDVKNVKRMRLAIFVLDSFAACKVLDGEAKSDLDLDAAVPTMVRAIDYSQYAPVVRHTETIALPELKLPGVYVVDCAGAGIASRALVRKGRLRVTHRRDSAGHVFTALDEKGAVVKGTKLRLGETVFVADDSGEISVPFSPDDKSAGWKTAVVTDGRLASTISFQHEREKIKLTLGLVLPAESLVAGQQATALLRPGLWVSGVSAPLGLLKNPVISAEFIDIDKRTSVMTFPDAVLSDGAETAVSFPVPDRLVSVVFRLKGSVTSSVTGKDEPCTTDMVVKTLNAIERSAIVGQAFLRRTSSGWRLELRGRTGEPLASRAIVLNLTHRAFNHAISERLQADENGVVELGALTDISSLDMEFDGNTYKWDIGGDSNDTLPSSLSAAAGESFEIPLRNLLTGEWPGAKNLNFRLSLIGLNADGETISDRIAACSYNNGILRIAGLPAGDYVLTLRDRGKVCRLYVAAAAPGSAGAGGVIASATRSLSDTGNPALLRISSAARDGNGNLNVRLENATPETRVHVFAARTFGNPGETRPVSSLGSFLDVRSVSVGTWGGRPTDYVSGRDLGGRLRYILERRDRTRHVGNMLFKPSLLLAPWNTAETDTKDVKLNGGDSWDEAVPPDAAVAGAAARGGAAYGDLGIRLGLNCWDFLPQGEKIVANIRPGKDGTVSLQLPGDWQDITVVAIDGRVMDHVSILGKADAFTPRNLTHTAVAQKAQASLTKGYSTFGELFGLSQSLCSNDGIADFRPLASWNTLSEDAKRVFYGEHICHELNFFLYMKDRPFFDAVVAPHLRNKRLRQFMDKWLLGEDMSEYASPGRLGDLNALEQGLLAIRIPAVAPVVARSMADECAAHPTAPEAVDAAFDIALDVMNKSLNNANAAMANAAEPVVERSLRSSSPGSAPSAPAAPAKDKAVAAADVCLEEVEAPPPEDGHAGVAAVKSKVEMKSIFGSVRASTIPQSARAAREMRRRGNRQLYRPPERTREWVESHWWKKRQSEDTAGLVPVNEFWRDWAAAIADGKTVGFRSPNMCLVRSGFSAQMAALAVTDVPFERKEDDSGLVFRREHPVESSTASPVVVTQRFRDPKAARADGSLGAEVSDEFVRGRVYELVTVFTNPTDDRRRVSAFIQIPDGAIALRKNKAASDVRMVLNPYSVEKRAASFYFPEKPSSSEESDRLRLASAEVIETDGSSSRAQPFYCNVVAKPTKADESSWEYLSQNGSKSAVLDFLRNSNLALVDLENIQWRMSDETFAAKALEILSSRGVYCQDLWLVGLLWKGSFDAGRMREVLSRHENQKKLGVNLGPAMESPLVTIDPEQADVFEHKEYWPIINARAHFVGGRTAIANEGLKTEYRAFLDTLAAKRRPTERDRILAAVYLLAQDRIDEAKAHVSAVLPAKESYKMQLDYLRAYLSFCDGDAEGGREIAAPYADYPVPLWRDRFRAVVAQADEVLGAGRVGLVAESDADTAPTLSISEDSSAVVISASNLSECQLKAYPFYLEVAFSKDPFGTEAQGRDIVRCLVPKWSATVSLKDGTARVELPKEVGNRNVVLVAEGAEGRAEAKLERTPRDFDVQITREYHQLRVKGRDGKPIAGAYVKVYAKDATGHEVSFHKDGYTDLRGAFDYSSISTDTSFRPAEFSILVLPEGRGATVQRVMAD